LLDLQKERDAWKVKFETVMKEGTQYCHDDNNDDDDDVNDDDDNDDDDIDIDDVNDDDDDDDDDYDCNLFLSFHLVSFV